MNPLKKKLTRLGPLAVILFPIVAPLAIVLTWLSMQPEPNYALAFWGFVAGAVGLAVPATLALFRAHQRPLDAVVTVLRRYSHGDFDARADEGAGDALVQQLARAANAVMDAGPAAADADRDRRHDAIIALDAALRRLGEGELSIPVERSGTEIDPLAQATEAASLRLGERLTKLYNEASAVSLRLVELSHAAERAARTGRERFEVVSRLSQDATRAEQRLLESNQTLVRALEDLRAVGDAQSNSAQSVRTCVGVVARRAVELERSRERFVALEAQVAAVEQGLDILDAFSRLDAADEVGIQACRSRARSVVQGGREALEGLRRGVTALRSELSTMGHSLEAVRERVQVPADLDASVTDGLHRVCQASLRATEPPLAALAAIERADEAHDDAVRTIENAAQEARASLPRLARSLLELDLGEGAPPTDLTALESLRAELRAAEHADLLTAGSQIDSAALRSAAAAAKVRLERLVALAEVRSKTLCNS